MLQPSQSISEDHSCIPADESDHEMKDPGNRTASGKAWVFNGENGERQNRADAEQLIKDMDGFRGKRQVLNGGLFDLEDISTEKKLELSLDELIKQGGTDDVPVKRSRLKFHRFNPVSGSRRGRNCLERNLRLSKRAGRELISEAQRPLNHEKASRFFPSIPPPPLEPAPVRSWIRLPLSTGCQVGAISESNLPRELGAPASRRRRSVPYEPPFVEAPLDFVSRQQRKGFAPELHPEGDAFETGLGTHFGLFRGSAVAFPSRALLPSFLSPEPVESFRPLQDAKISRPTASQMAAEDSALSEIEILYPPMVKSEDGGAEMIPSSDDALIVNFKGTEVLKIRKTRGEMVLSSGGWRTLSTRLVLNNALKPLQIWIEATSCPAHEDQTSQNTAVENDHSGDPSALVAGAPCGKSPFPRKGKKSEENMKWTVLDGKSFLAAFHDGMVIGHIGTSSRTHLLARASVVAQHLKQIKSNAMKRRLKLQRPLR